VVKFGDRNCTAIRSSTMVAIPCKQNQSRRC